MCARSPRTGVCAGSANFIGPSRAKVLPSRLPVSKNYPMPPVGCGRLDRRRSRGKLEGAANAPAEGSRDQQSGAEPLSQHSPRCAQAQGIAALGPAGLGRGTPGKRVEMRPVGALGNELVEEQP